MIVILCTYAAVLNLAQVLADQQLKVICFKFVGEKTPF